MFDVPSELGKGQGTSMEGVPHKLQEAYAKICPVFPDANTFYWKHVFFRSIYPFSLQSDYVKNVQE